jgi:hypothetical protein
VVPARVVGGGRRQTVYTGKVYIKASRKSGEEMQRRDRWYCQGYNGGGRQRRPCLYRTTTAGG